MTTTATAPETTTTTPSGTTGIIPDGHRWTSKNGAKCYKIPQKQFQDVVAILPNVDVTKLTDAQLVNALAYCNERYAERNADEFLVFPVRYEKQASANTMYFSRLAAFQKNLRAEQANRAKAALFGE